MLREILQNQGATVKKRKIVNYKTGYQVAIESQEIIVESIFQAMRIIRNLTSCGVWIEKEKIYIDSNTKRVKTKKEALKIAKENNQIAIWDWKNRRAITV